MRIFFKYIAKCMMEKKARLFLLILAIAMSTGLLVTINGAVDVTLKSFEKPMTEQFEGKDLIITSTNNKPFMDISEIKESGIKNFEGKIIVNGIINEDETTKINIQGAKKEIVNADNIISGDLSTFEEDTCIISKRVSQERNLDINDYLEFYMGGEKKKYKIIAIVKNEGAFYLDGKNSFTIIVPYEKLAKILGVNGKYNYIVANKISDNIEDCIEEFNSDNKNFEAKKLFDTDAIEKQMQMIKYVLYTMLSIVVVMSTVIIYSSFKLTITERLSTIGTFLSQGATTGTVERILFLESGVYGLIGSVFGNILGLGGLYLVNYISSPLSKYGIIEKLSVKLSYFIIGIIFAIVLSCISALIPIIKIRKIEVKDIILNNVNISMKIGWKKFIVGSLLLIISIIIAVLDEEWTENVSIIFIFVSATSIILMYPKIVDLISTVLYRVLRGRSKSAVLALNNLRTSKVLMGNITLIIISMLAIFMISSIGSSMVSVVSDAYTDLKYDVSVQDIEGIDGVSGKSVTEKIVDELEKNPNIDKESIKTITNAMATSGKSMAVIEACDPKSYEEFNKYLELDSKKNKEIYKEYKNSSLNEKKIIISKNLQKELGLNKGDEITLEVNDIKSTFNIVGIIDGKLQQSGYIILMSEELIKQEFNIKESSQIMFKTDKNPKEVKKILSNELKDFGVTVDTKIEMEERNHEMNQVTVDMLGVFSYLAIIIAALGVLNNVIIGFIQRKKEIAVLSSVGMTDASRNFMLVIESVLTVIWATVIVVPYSYLGLALLSKLMISIGIPLEVSLDLKAIPIYFIASVIIILLATIPIIVKNKKLSIVQELKYE